MKSTLTKKALLVALCVAVAAPTVEAGVFGRIAGIFKSAPAPVPAWYNRAGSYVANSWVGNAVASCRSGLGRAYVATKDAAKAHPYIAGTVATAAAALAAEEYYLGYGRGLASRAYNYVFGSKEADRQPAQDSAAVQRPAAAKYVIVRDESGKITAAA